MLATISGHAAGCTQVIFDNNYMLVGTRSADWVYHWDLRYESEPIQKFYRAANTPQRMYFDYDSQTKSLVVGNMDGSIRNYNLSETDPNEDPEVSLIKSHFPMMFDSVSCIKILDSSPNITKSPFT